MFSFRQSLRGLLGRSLRARDASLQRSTAPWLRNTEAMDRAIQLLTHNLSPAQREQFAKHGYFDVIGGDTGRRYRIRHGCQMNVALLDNRGRLSRLLCFLPGGCLPVEDVMLAQKIALELFESDALSVAIGAVPPDYYSERELPRSWPRR